MRVRKGWHVFTKVCGSWLFAHNGNFSKEFKTNLTDLDIDAILNSVTDYGLTPEAKKYFKLTS